jgi:hypothetical protein
MKRVWVFRLLVSAAFILLTTCTEQEPPLVPNVAPDPMLVGNLRADYTQSSSKVNLSWDVLDWSRVLTAGSDSGFYRVFRLTKNPQGDTSSFKTIDFDKSSTSGSDILGLDNTTYYYSIGAIVVHKRSGTIADTVVGSIGPTSLASVVVKSGVLFNINKGSVFTAVDLCSLIINLPQQNLLSSVRFTQDYIKNWKKTDGTRMRVYVDDPDNPPSVDSMLIKNGWLTSAAKLAPGVTEEVLADFSTTDPRNSTRSYSGSSMNEGDNFFAWWLKKGNGTKKVWAELTYTDGRVDTISDNIDIAPYRIQINFRNKTGSADETMRIRKLSSGGTGYFIYKPIVQFNVSIFADTTIDTAFSYWLAIADTTPTIPYIITDPLKAWLETKPRAGRLSGIGPAHNDDSIYTYMLDTLSERGRENLSDMRKTIRSPQGDLAFRLKGLSYLNETCVPGSFWGKTPLYWNGSNFDSTQIPILLSPGNAFKKVRAVQKSPGTKEVIVIAVFKGRYFGDTRTAASSGEALSKYNGRPEGEGPRGLFDLYQPRLYFLGATGDDGWQNNGSIINSTFNVALGRNMSIEDAGYANVTSLRLLIAKNDGSIPWNLVVSDIAATRKVTADTLSLGAVQKLRYVEIPFPIIASSSIIYGVKWTNLDLTDWPSGSYIMGVIARDQFGNEGFAPPMVPATADKPWTNPWQVTIFTGK